MNTIGYAIAACGVMLALLGTFALWRTRRMHRDMQELCEKHVRLRESFNQLNQMLEEVIEERTQERVELEGQLDEGVRQLQQTIRARDHAVLQAKASRVSHYCGAYDQEAGCCTKGMRTYPTKDGTKKCSPNCPEFVWAGPEGDNDGAA